MSFHRVNRIDHMLNAVIASYPNVKDPRLLREVLIGALPRHVDGKLAAGLTEAQVRDAVRRIALRSPSLFEFIEPGRIARIKNTPYSELTSDEDRRIWRGHNGRP